LTCAATPYLGSRASSEVTDGEPVPSRRLTRWARPATNAAASMSAAIQQAALRVALVGAGRWGANIARVLAGLPRCRLIALCDLDPEKGALARALPGCRFTSRYDEILTAPDIEAVVLATPPPSHAELVLAALRQAKHVYVEKPLAMTVREALDIRAAAQASGRRVMVGHILEYHPGIVELKRLVRTGMLGSPRWVVSERLSPLSAQQKMDDAWWTFAPHDVSVICSVLAARPLEVAVVHEKAVVGRLVFPSCTATIRVGYVDGDKVRRMIVAGTWRTALFDDTLREGKLAIYPRLERVAGDGDRFPAPSREPLETPALESVEPLEAELRHFVEAVLDDKPILTGAEVGLSTVSVLEAGAISIASGGRAIKLEHRDAQSSNAFSAVRGRIREAGT
jgi:predicted dehydrogenase